MYALRNKVQLIGNLGAAPEVRTLESGKKMARFTIATSEVYKNATGERIKETQWHQVVAWGQIADIAARYLEKGREVAIEGKLVHRDFTDAKGVKKYITEVQATELLLLGTKASV
ncbi:single-stranded DNA-binding protein [Niabella insulamsoli]|uniref:single-stranded DNA-binding protein n=1 Tax=Niabella insulamsoli TaxID=3144874 RepID=UPI0031FC5D35